MAISLGDFQKGAAELNLREADLSKADLRHANLRGRLEQCQPARSQPERAIIDDTTILDDKWQLVWEIVNRVRWGATCARST
jgi:hypothetical protein